MMHMTVPKFSLCNYICITMGKIIQRDIEKIMCSVTFYEDLSFHALLFPST